MAGADGSHFGILNEILGLASTSHPAKISCANRQPEGDQRGCRRPQRMERIPDRVVQDHQERGLEELC